MAHGLRLTVLSAMTGAIVIAGLAGCTPPAPPEDEPTASESSPTVAPEPAEAVFVAPSTCTQLLGADLENEFLGGGNVLFSSTDGTGIYFPIESTQDGGTPFSCWYGKDMVDLSTFELAAQALTQDAHEGTLAVLQGGGFVETTDGDVVTFTQVGDEGATPAIVHVLRPDSWITGFSALGGADRAALVADWVDSVAEQVYPVP